MLIVVSSFSELGGVSNHHMGLKSYWKLDVAYEFYGKRYSIPAIFLFVFDLLKYTIKLCFGKYDIVMINPSLRRYQLFRDGIYLILAKLFNKKVITFIHGWDKNLANHFIEKPNPFYKVYNKSDIIYVLCNEFKTKLLKIGLKSNILLTTTKVSDSLVKEFNINKRSGIIKDILFLGRVVKNKGIFETIEIFQILIQKNPELTLTVVGDGKNLKESKDYVKRLKLNNVNFVGKKMNDEIIPFFEKADLYLLPTTHGEGMPTSVLESMAFGLPVITRPVGGTVDFFREGEMGYLIKSLNPQDYVNKISTLINNPNQTKKISKHNFIYAKSNFLASLVTKKMEGEILRCIK